MAPDIDQARQYISRDGVVVRAAQYHGDIAAFHALGMDFPDRAAPHPKRDRSLLLRMDSGRAIRLDPGDWVVEAPGGAMSTCPDDQFAILYTIKETILV